MTLVALRSVSPILDGYRLGDIISRSSNSVCCHATEGSSGQPFVLKVISIPASAVQMDALLMTGAFPDRTAANTYYKEQARNILNEAKSLRHLAALGGFADFDSVQVVPAPDQNGFEIYLLSPRRTSLQQMFQKKNLTQLQIVNMALDICSALMTCRHSGFLYADLKPSNVFCIGQRYRIGDLGLMRLSAIGHEALPSQYRSSYSPPELRRDQQKLNSSADVYALGMMLYEAYNGGVLPGKEDQIGQLLAPPKYADYEMAEIILRACAPDPSIRWSDPEQMRYALTRYTQRNGLHDTLIVPRPIVPAVTECPPVIEDFLPESEEDLDLFISEWDSPLPSPSSSQESAPPRQRERTAHRLQLRHWIVLSLALILLIELVIGACLLLN